MKQVNKNFIYNVIYQIFIYIIPLISVPYVSRKLGVDNIGIYSYTYSIVYYFMLAAMLGINNYGTREIAKCKDNIEKRSRLFCSLYLMQIILNLVMLVLYMIAIVVLNNYKKIMIIQTIYLISVMFDINWLFFGMEKFKITISRNVIIKILSLCLIFVFVRNECDLWKYTIIMALSTLVSQLYLFIYLKKYISIKKVSLKDAFSHLKKCIVLFIPVIAYSIYRVMDKTMIGAIVSTKELGFYENAEKIINIPISFITALGTVMLPYMSKSSDGTAKEYNEKIFKTFKLAFCLIIPMVFGLIVVGEDFSNVFFGKAFYKTGNLIRLLSISIIFTTVANVVRTNYLIPKEMDRIYVASTVTGAIFNLVFNLILIPRIGAYGAAVGTIIAEFSVMMYQLFFIKKEVNLLKVFGIFATFFAKGIIMALIIICVGACIKNEVIRLIVQVIVAIIIYFLMNFNYIVHDFLGKKVG